MVGHKLDTTTLKTLEFKALQRSGKETVLKTVEQDNKNKQTNLETLRDFVNPNIHRSFTLNAALITSLKESREFRKAQESSGI